MRSIAREQAAVEGIWASTAACCIPCRAHTRAGK
jgi:hypothetical protein